MNINQVNSISRAVAQQEIERTVVNPFMLRQEADVTNSSNSVPVVVDDLVVPVVSFYSGWPPENFNIKCPTCLREISRLPSVRKQNVKGVRDTT